MSHVHHLSRYGGVAPSSSGSAPQSDCAPVSVHGGWSSWSSWSSCSGTCIAASHETNAPIRTRRRSCSNPAPSTHTKTPGNRCEGAEAEQQACSELPNCPGEAPARRSDETWSDLLCLQWTADGGRGLLLGCALPPVGRGFGCPPGNVINPLPNTAGSSVPARAPGPRPARPRVPVTTRQDRARDQEGTRTHSDLCVCSGWVLVRLVQLGGVFFSLHPSRPNL